jgi:hypothetical protein
VVLLVPDAEEEPPEWPTGDALVVANSGAIYVSSICDVDGHVDIEVWWGTMPDQLQQREPIYDGVLAVRDAGAFVGSYTGDQLAHLPMLREGEHQVQVYTDLGGPHAERVYFVVD